MKGFFLSLYYLIGVCIHIWTISLAYTNDGWVVALFAMSAPVAAELWIGFQSILHVGLINLYTLVVGGYVAVGLLGAGWFREPGEN